MRGPKPKPPEQRQRRNKTTGKSELMVVDDTQMVMSAPALPDIAGGWHTMTRMWWDDVWNSPQGKTEFLAVDIHALLRLAVLINMYWTLPTVSLGAEIRLQQQAFGLTPMDRRRLEWTVVQTEDAKDAREKRRPPTRPVTMAGDVREVLD